MLSRKLFVALLLILFQQNISAQPYEKIIKKMRHHYSAAQSGIVLGGLFIYHGFKNHPCTEKFIALLAASSACYLFAGYQYYQAEKVRNDYVMKD